MVLREFAVAVLLGLLLFALPVAAALLGMLGELPPPWQLGARSTAWELSLQRDAAEALLAELHTAGRPGLHLELEERDGSLWLLSIESEAGGAGPDLGSRGAWTGELRLESGFARILERSLRDPGHAAAAFPLLVPWMFLSSSLAFLVVGLVGRHRRPEPRWRAPPGPPLRPIVLGLGLGGLLALLGAAVSGGLAALGFEIEEQKLVRDLAEAGGGTFALFAAAAVLLAPLAEEIFFRGHLFRRLTLRRPAWQAHGITALLFAGIHLNPAALPIYALDSLGLSLAYARTRSLVVPIVAHGVLNLVGVVTLFLAA
jgi:membrane protease YdiL (CAAX protease family)